jgi:hypothetical protein
VHQLGITGAQLAELAGIRRGAEDKGRSGLKRAKDVGELAFAQGADDNEVVRRNLVILPEVAAEDSNSGRLPFGLPASGQQPGKFCFVGKD